MVKKVSVDRYTQEFNEEGFGENNSGSRRRQVLGMGEVRKFVHDLREQ